MPKKKRTRTPEGPNERESEPAPRSAPSNHRLRGGELADDFADADADSSVAKSQRDEKQSDS